MAVMETELTRGETFIVKWKYGGLSHFGAKLIDVLLAADGPNLQRLSLAFPEEVSAMQKYWTQTGWWRRVQEKAGKDPEL